MAGIALAAALASAPAPAAEKPQKPNIVTIISDDQGFADVGFHGSDIRTPNLDALAAGGARLEQFYAQPMCSPTRAALMTGRYPFRYGLQIAIPPYLRAADRRMAPASGAEGGARYRGIADPARRAYAAQVTAMDAEIGRVVKALNEKKTRDNTLVVFQSDNGGTHNPMFSGEVDTSALKSLPPDNGPYREGKGTVYEGGTRVVAVMNWPGHIKPGTMVDEMIHEVDLYPTLLGLAGASAVKAKTPLDGLDVWGTISAGKPSPRTEIVYDLQPFRAGLRQGDWKLVWRTPLPQVVELYDIARDPSEKDNLAAANPDKVAALQKRANALAAAMIPPLILQTEFKAMKQRLSLPPALPDDDVLDGAAE